jgi:predicted enzyme related to lactoylglutathione lyase
MDKKLLKIGMFSRFELQTSDIAGLGGKIVVLPQDIPGVGRFSVLLDPQGAMLSVITYK